MSINKIVQLINSKAMLTNIIAGMNGFIAKRNNIAW
jgi:hypothetical protein